MPGSGLLFFSYTRKSAINFEAGQTIASSGIFGLDGGGALAVLAGGSDVNVILDVNGYLE